MLSLLLLLLLGENNGGGGAVDVGRCVSDGIHSFKRGRARRAKNSSSLIDLSISR